ncbi:probable lipid phosphate phosphatase beta [Cryptomeria japonica]|uniref:probable lipid phosphate phosphatase beta n=1 Tax=Cryptomeria japonica TaxID=3369 RepID=UPI0027D9F4C0|nr:probable lipid phosphate phosphatase beta [Cryptomeria japonica]
MSSYMSKSMIGRVLEVDRRWSLYIHNTRVPRMFLKALEISGDGLLWIPATAALWLTPFSSFAIPKIRWVLLNLLIGFLFDLVLIGSLKSIIRRPRPEYNKGMYLVVSVDHWSFPSGHASRACFIGSFLCLCLQFLEAQIPGSVGGNQSVGIFRAVVILIMAWAIATSTSRILLGRHYVLDVMAGGCLGVLEALIVHNLLSVSERVSETSYLWVVSNACRQQKYLPYSFCKDFNTGI